MKFLILLTSAFAIVASVNSIITPKLNFDEMLIEVDNLLKSSPKFKSEILMARNQIEFVEELQSKPSFNLKRRKRQATSVNCTAIQMQLQNDKNEIEPVKAKITNSTITQTTLSKQVKSYEDKVKTAIGSSLKTAQNLLSIYQRLLNSIVTLLETSQKSKTTLEANVAKIENEIQMYCVVTTAAPNVHQCGTFLPYDTKNLKTAPTVNGFAGGINFLDSSTTYVGFGNGATCSNQVRAPCALSVTGSSPGCNIPCGPNQIYDGTTSYYLLSHPNLAWTSTITEFPNALRILGPENFMFGRALVDGKYLLGKVLTSNGVNTFQSVAASGSIQLTNGFEVLTCSVPSCPCSGSTATPVTSTLTPTEATSGNTSPIQDTSTQESNDFPVKTVPTETTSQDTSSTQTAAPTNPPCDSDTLQSGGGMSLGSSKTSCIDGYKMTFQNDGDLVVTSSSGAVIWRSGTANSGANSLEMKSDGSFSIYNANENVIWSTSWYVAPVAGSSAQISGNGIIYVSKDNQASWSSEMKSPNFAPCGTFMKYDIVNQKSYPVDYGVVGGYSFDNLNAEYVGFGKMICDSPLPINWPGSILISNEPYTTGSLMVCGSKFKMDDTNAHFLLNHPNLRWVDTDNVTMTSLSNQIKISGGQNTFFVGRILYNGKYRSGKVLAYTSNDHLSMISELYSVQTYSSGFQILTCFDPNAPPTTTSTLAPTNPPCDDTLQSEGSLSLGSSKTSCVDGYKMTLQNDGDFVVTSSTGAVTWRSGTANSGAYSLEMRPDGSLELIDANVKVIWSSSWYAASVAGSSAQISNNGIIYVSKDNQASWSSEMKSPNLAPCGTFMKYDTVNQVTYPEMYGVVGSYGYSNGVEYVGYGKLSCGNSVDSDWPGIIAFTTAEEFSSGAYMFCTNRYGLDTDNSYFLLNHPNLKWVDADNITMTSLSNQIKITGDQITFFVSRILVNGNYRFGKLHAYTGNDFITLINNRGVVSTFSDGFQILTCEDPTKTTTTVATTTTTEAPTTTTEAPTTTTEAPLPTGCGSLIKYNTADSSLIKSLGFTGGIHLDESIVYAGIGNNAMCAEPSCPARLSTSASPPGAYMSCGLRSFDDQNAYFFRKHDDLYWIPTDSDKVTTVNGRIQLNSTRVSRMVGRKTTIYNYQTIGKIYNEPNYDFYFTSPINEEITTRTDFDVLVCDPNPACGTFVYFDTHNTPNAPIGKGFVGAVNKYGSNSYVGRGNNQNLGQYPCPGKVLTGSSAGVHMSATPFPYNDKYSAYFLLNHQDLHWIPTNKDAMGSLTGSLKVKTTNNIDLSYGRVFVDGYAYLGKVHDGASLNYITESGQEATTQSFELLVCNPSLTPMKSECANRIEAGRCLAAQEIVQSCYGCTILTLERDGNLVVYTNYGDVIWATGSQTFGATKACMQHDGNFVLFDSNNGVIWSTVPLGTTPAGFAYAEIQDDGQFKVYLNGEVQFQSGSTHACSP